ncbi:6281_t:CDS:2 [Acaulospora colombiana]|uniref:6281_t:CDS:1 n=1 Tax=Acaulospora colombiana TaxID=27376 RepID=A0ACA9L2P6_9GLOM|nr:6281_t:CDS:2 [Acaulospora colombiana]
MPMKAYPSHYDTRARLRRRSVDGEPVQPWSGEWHGGGAHGRVVYGVGLLEPPHAQMGRVRLGRSVDFGVRNVNEDEPPLAALVKTGKLRLGLAIRTGGSFWSLGEHTLRHSQCITATPRKLGWGCDCLDANYGASFQSEYRGAKPRTQVDRCRTKSRAIDSHELGLL